MNFNKVSDKMIMRCMRKVVTIVLIIIGTMIGFVLIDTARRTQMNPVVESVVDPLPTTAFDDII